MYKVETHNNSKEYFRNLIIDEEAIYITANNSISNMIKETTQISEEERWRSIDIENFTKTVYPIWNSTINKIKLKAQLRLDLLEVKNTLINEIETKEMKFLEENLSLLFSDFVFLVEAGVRKLNHKFNDVKLELLKVIFNKFTQGEYFKKVSNEVFNFECFSDIGDLLTKAYIENIAKNNKDRSKHISKKIEEKDYCVKKVYLYNINYLDLKRYMMIEMLKLSGYEIVFRIPYFSNLKVVNKNWDMLYKNESLFNIEINENYSTSVRENLKYLEFIEGNKITEYEYEKVKIKNYREVCDFKKDINNNMVVTFYKDSLESCMKREELNLKNHCYQSALGRFIFNLYECKVEDNTIKINFNTFREMITSGWIQYKDWNGNRLSSFLMDNEEYFSGVKTIDEIIIRIEKLKDIEEIGGIFEEQVKNRIKNNKTKAFLSNPFRAFGYANLEKYNITANYMLEVSLRLKRFILKVFEGENEEIDVNSHLENMEILFRNKYIVSLYKDGTDIEKRILKKIYGVIKNPTLFGDKLHKDEFSELFNVYLFLDVDHEKVGEQEEDFSIDQLEGIILRDKLFAINKDKRLYIADLSYNAYEKYTEKYRLTGKILSMDELKVIFKENLTGRNREVVLQGFFLQEKSKAAFESYVKFALANLVINFDGEIELSWIEGFRNNDSKSILLKQIETIYGNTHEVKQKLDFDDVINEEDIKDINHYGCDKNLIKNKEKNLPEVAFRDLDFCGEKFLYSSILEEYPNYYSEFHHKLVFSALISMLKNSIEDGYSGIYNYILPLFPQWEDVVKKNVLDCEYSRKNLKEYRYFDGINYPKNTYALYLLKSKYIVTENSKIRNKYNKGEFSGKKYYDEFVDDYLKDESLNNGFHCMMCPHCYVCKKGDFVIDRK